MSDFSNRPPILRLPEELHIHIISFFTTEVLKCCLTKIGPYCSEGRFTWQGTVHISPNDHVNAAVPVTHPAILSLRSTNTYFLSLIPLSQELLLQIERHPSTPRTPIGPLRACCVCLRLRPSNEFAISAYSGPQHTGKSYVEQSFGYRARYRFCRDCGFHAYPHPHPALSPRRRQVRRGTAPVQLTTYAPGTKLLFLQDEPNTSGYATWVWCMDCRLLKTYMRSGEADCRFFCKECCTRLGCRVGHHPYNSPARSTRRVVEFEHRGYAGIAEEVTAEKKRREHRLRVGAVYVARGRSLLLKNVEQPYDEEQEEVGGDGEDKAWRDWFDLEGYSTLLRTPLKRLPVGAVQVCALFRPR